MNSRIVFFGTILTALFYRWIFCQPVTKFARLQYYALFGQKVPEWDGKIRGFVTPGWERVREELSASFREGREIGAQVAVFHKGEMVVSIVAGSALVNERDWEGGGGSHGNSFVNMTVEMIHPLFSSTKVAESTVIGMLADRGRLDFGAKVSELWPEFAAGGKDELTIQDIMRHQGGLASPDERFKSSDLKDLEKLGSILARQTTNWDVKARKHQMYHPVTRGMYSGEIARRADPKGRSMSEFFREEVADKYGLKFIMGVKEEEWERETVSEQLPPPYLVILKYIPQYLMGKLVSANTWGRLMGGDTHDVLQDDERSIVLGFIRKFFGSAYLNFAAAGSVAGVVEGMDKIEDINNVELLKLECLGSANGLANAEGMAKLADLIRKGELFDVRGGAMEVGERVRDEGLGFDLAYTACGYGDDRFLSRGLVGWKGWAGMAGSVLQWNEELELAFSYNTVLPYMRVGKPRGNRLMAVIEDIVRGGGG
ncbi:hypothetical protein TrCOL_g2820 [Triparma columacea]|uniref:Beta-lactamase-related domain-containing protein n=1 Tax=Triparma columacea TaxID=722753 RepID=A0A9W7L7R0_9STRA|nr:hypothetical protein TrCOL_g2820 [Triparma columacea]